MLILGAHTWVDGWFDFQSKRWALIFWMGMGLTILALLAVTYVKRSTQQLKEDYQLPLLATSVVLVLTLGLAEIVLRVIAVDDPLGDRIGPVVLRPYDWDAFVEHNAAIYERSKHADAFYVGHEQLGWAVGSSRKSADGMYVSSVNGLRSEKQGEDLLNAPHNTRLALYGDSFMFSEEVSFDDSLQKFLQAEMPQGGQVVTFGVPGYGIDQAVRSFELSASQWRPEVVVLAFIRDDFRRALNIHTSLKVTWGIPFSKPRYVFEGSELRTINDPAFSVDRMLDLSQVGELPHLALEEEYFAHDWQGPLLLGSHLLRFLYSVYPSWDEPTGTKEMTALGGALVNRFLDRAQLEGRQAIAVYLPSKSDFRENNKEAAQSFLKELTAIGVNFFDATDCLLAQVSPEALYVEGGTHYSREGNRALAGCLSNQLNLEITEDGNTQKTLSQ